MKRDHSIADRLTRILQGNSLQAGFIVVFVLFLLPWKSIPAVGGFSAAQYFLTYSDAFMSRALTGTVSTFLMGLSGSEPFFTGLYLLTVFGYAASAVVWMTGFLRSGNRESLTFLFLLILALPLTFMPLRDEFGRLDFLLYALEFLVCAWIARESRSRVLIPAMILLCVLINEESLLLVCPLIAAAVFWKLDFKRRFSVLTAAGTMAAIILGILLAWYFRAYQPPAFLIESNILRRNISPYPAYYVPAELREPLPEILSRIGEWAFRNGETTFHCLASVLFYLIALIQPGILWTRIFRAKGIAPSLRRRFLLLFLSASVPLLLCCVSMEWVPVFAASIAAHFIALSLILTDTETPVILSVPGNHETVFLLLIILFFLPQGKSRSSDFSDLSAFAAQKAWQTYDAVRHSPGKQEREEGLALMKQRDFPSAEKKFALSAELGDPEGTAWYGLALFYGWGAPPNWEKAFSCFRSAAEQGNDLGRHMAGFCLIQGCGVKTDPVSGVRLLKQAVRRGQSREAEYQLSHCYSEGIGVKKDDSAAFVYLWRAACGNPNAAYELALHYLDGKKVPVNRKEAAFWANRSAYSLHPGGSFLLAQFCLAGDVVPYNRDRAIRLLKGAAIQGYVPAQNLLNLLENKEQK